LAAQRSIGWFLLVDFNSFWLEGSVSTPNYSERFPFPCMEVLEATLPYYS